MPDNKAHTGFAIAIAWPELYCKQSLSWYDYPAGMLGISKSNYYRAGHAALVLVDIADKKCHYFDFGRYHAPFNHGRVRSAVSDHELQIKTVAEISEDGNSLLNFRNILEELQNNRSCHGAGVLYASYSKIDFPGSYEMATFLQTTAIPYGPFEPGRSNCSRFVNRALLAGKPGFIKSFRLRFFVPLTPTPMNNVNSLGKYTAIPHLEPYDPSGVLAKHDRKYLRSTLAAPVRNEAVPEGSQWLGGEGAGSWFHLEEVNNKIFGTRYSPDGIIECRAIYRTKDGDHKTAIQPATVTYPSDCSKITLLNDKGISTLYLAERLF